MKRNKGLRTTANNTPGPSAASETDAKIEKNMQEWRIQYHRGTLAAYKIKRIEKIPGWTWGAKIQINEQDRQAIGSLFYPGDEEPVTVITREYGRRRKTISAEVAAEELVIDQMISDLLLVAGEDGHRQAVITREDVPESRPEIRSIASYSDARKQLLEASLRGKFRRGELSPDEIRFTEAELPGWTWTRPRNKKRMAAA
jgi:hypothetical protein